MFYIKKDEESRHALSLIQEVLQAHQKMLEDKEAELISISSEEIKEQINQMLKNKISKQAIEDSPHIELLTAEIEILDIKIAAIKYTYDYVKLMLKQCKTSGNNI